WLESCAGSNAIGGDRAPPSGGMMSLTGRWMRGDRLSAWTCRHTDGEAARKIVPPRLLIPYWKGLVPNPKRSDPPMPGDLHRPSLEPGPLRRTHKHALGRLVEHDPHHLISAPRYCTGSVVLARLILGGCDAATS